MPNYYKTRVLARINELDEFQLRVVLGFIEKLFARPKPADIIYLHKEEKVA